MISPLSDVLGSLQEKLAALEGWARRVQREEHMDGPEAVPAVRIQNGSHVAPLASAGVAAPTTQTVRQAQALLVAAHQQAAAIMEEANAANERQRAEARKLADQIRSAAEAAAEYTLAAAEEAMRYRTAAAEQQVYDVLAFAHAPVARLTGAPDSGTPPAPITTARESLDTLPESTPSSISTPARSTIEDLPRARSAEPMITGAQLESVELVAGPFRRFSQLAGFTRALRAMPGLDALDTRRFFRGMVYLRVRYDDPVPLTDRLARLPGHHCELVSASDSRIEVRVVSPADGDPS